jgi:geranyl-CoA carboxylase alpha subunit
LIAHAHTREQAALALADGLERTVCLGVANNSGFLAQVLRSDVFLQGEFNTSVLHTDLKHLPAQHHSSSLHAIAALVVACVPRHAHATPSAAWWNWHSSGHVAIQVPLRIGGQLQHWQVHMQQQVWRVSQADEIFELSDLQLLPALAAANGIDPYAMAKGQLQLTLNRQPLQLFYAWAGNELWLQLGGDAWMVEDARLQPQAQSASSSSNQVHAPMHGRVVRLEVAAGDAVTSGQLLLVMEAMKMEHHLHAPRDGTVQGVHANAGMQVSRGQTLVQLTP